jgi:hypothetical protein
MRHTAFFIGLFGLGVATSAAADPAAPVFRSDVPEDAKIAEIAWQAAMECTGRPGKAHAEVTLARGNVRGGYLGVAHHDDQGLYHIELDAHEERLAEVIVHEVAHAWVSEGPTALTEGRTELLADCVVTRRPGLAPLQWDDGHELLRMPDLKSWSNHTDHGPSVSTDERTDAYLGAARLVRTAALLIPEQAWWPDKAMQWSDFKDLLVLAGEDGKKVIDLFEASVSEQRLALADEDLDGLPRVAEELLGTHPNKWDSDGDGWWDGSVTGAPMRAVAIPFDGTPVCTGLSATGPVRITSGGNLRGGSLPKAHIRAGHRSGLAMDVAARTPVLVEIHGARNNVSGGMWGAVEGANLEVDDRCVMTVRGTVWVENAKLAKHLPAFLEELERAAAKADERWGPATKRIAVYLGGPRTSVDNEVILLGNREIDQALQQNKMSELAFLAVALHRLWGEETYQWSVAEAVAKSLAAE